MTDDEYSAGRGFTVLLAVIGCVIAGAAVTGVAAAIYVADVVLPRPQPGTEGPGDGFELLMALFLGSVPGAVLGLLVGLRVRQWFHSR